ncbi:MULTISPECIES: Spx/MgsR family RNA polymerase-binding regulatory protein [unclassified Breznakia]|uniref:Spx/MgsR family RNA polymerase-binding regulatory protein n=1 Tax=unclassified Breznakia TaxID=2623764 RepID=UPI00247612DA|nr:MULTISPECIES: Spx/MgsR family RNA polymerase-binding regulatory protein [unclassified Breznakia]MDH6366977.1 regulatory protein spx [Breznakia sp. PH1-1]MDH6404155.1 regulatory protein spx [Breznakia sp. PF1-11]MDH6411864.1 regulatory protein spx [Breznakia sp. PFB1-11]MDH6414143.1 regulatory protein spx [Breznakia sp. PFB1-14]MDH6416500.1 regulatory protein spx [Breznakia sp. PFB1-4]
MIILYSSPGCASCRKAKRWLQERNLDFVEKNIFATILKADEIKYLLSRSDNGTEDLISTRSRPYQELVKDLDEMSMEETIRFVQQNPSVMKRPIIINEDNFLVGYDDDEITAFVPKELRNIADCGCNPSCPNYPICGSLRKGDEQEYAR